MSTTSDPVLFSQDFIQTIGNFLYTPFTTWQRFFNPQFIFNYNPEDESVERAVLNRVGSYGRQLGIVISVIELLINKMDTHGLTSAQQEVVKELKDLAATAHKTVAEYRGELGPADTKRVATFIEDCRTNFPDSFKQLEAKFLEMKQNVPHRTFAVS